MLQASEQAIVFLEGRQRIDFDRDLQLQLAVVRCLEIVGEAAARVTPELKLTHAEIPWRQMVATRNQLIHAYFNINLNIVWRTVREELPVLMKRLQEILGEVVE
jgi:uncharacterized protein with HEPN domain